MRLRRASTTSPSISILSSFSAIAASDRDDVRGLGALLTLAGLELHLRTLDERLEALADDVGVVDEEILAALVRADEAIALRVVEPLDCSGCHQRHLASGAAKPSRGDPTVGLSPGRPTPFRLPP